MYKDKRVLELFAGSRSIGKAAEELGMSIFSTDINNFKGINYVVDIFDFDYKRLPYKPNIICASPPCTGFSVASMGKHWRIINGVYVPVTETARKGLKIVRKTIEIIRYLDPKYWYIENPRGMLRKTDIMWKLKRRTITYCQYGDTRMKPTDIWTNNTKWKPRPMCKNNDPCHIAAPRGSSTGTQGLKGNYERSKIPHDFCIEILKACN